MDAERAELLRRLGWASDNTSYSLAELRAIAEDTLDAGKADLGIKFAGGTGLTTDQQNLLNSLEGVPTDLATTQANLATTTGDVATLNTTVAALPDSTEVETIATNKITDLAANLSIIGGKLQVAFPGSGGTYISTEDFNLVDGGGGDEAYVSYVTATNLPGVDNDAVTAIQDIVTTNPIPASVPGGDSVDGSIYSRLHSPGASGFVTIRNLFTEQVRSDLNPTAGYAVVLSVANWGPDDTNEWWTILSVGPTSNPASVLNPTTHAIIVKNADNSMALKNYDGSAQFETPVDATGLTFSGGIVPARTTITLWCKQDGAGQIRVNGTNRLTADLRPGAHVAVCVGGQINDAGFIRGKLDFYGYQVLLAPTLSDITTAETDVAS